MGYKGLDGFYTYVLERVHLPELKHIVEKIIH